MIWATIVLLDTMVLTSADDVMIRTVTPVHRGRLNSRAVVANATSPPSRGFVG